MTLLAAVLFAALFIATALAGPRPRLVWNASASAPIGLYRLSAVSHPAVGMLVVIGPPMSLARFLDERRYLPIGVPLLKHVAARPGARICRFGARVTIDGHVAAVALSRDTRGRLLPRWRGCRTIAPGQLFVLNAAADSMDGRYFGPIPASGLIGRVVSSGADDLLLRPFSTAVLGQRIESQIDRRKGFVIATDYVGPDRRGDGARPGGGELFEPPNSLRMKAVGKLGADLLARRLEADLRQAREKLLCERLRRDSFQICILWRLLQERPYGPGAASSDLDRLIGLARSVHGRCRGTQFEPAVEWCESILAAAEGLDLGVDRNASMHLLGHAALSMHLIFHPEKTPAEQIGEIDAMVVLIRERHQTEALAS